MELEEKLKQIASRVIPPNRLTEAFDLTACCVLNKCRLVIGEYRFDIVEIEFYFSSSFYNHIDPYSHTNLFKNCTRQGEMGLWYFHRFQSSKTYPRQKFRGLDLTFGNRENQIFGGILIRKIQNHSLSLNGIGKIVSFIEKILGIHEIEQLATRLDLSAFSRDSLLHLESTDKPSFPVFKSRRVLPNPNNSEKETYFQKKQRYFIDPEIEIVGNS